MKRRGGCAIKKMSRSNLSSRRRGFAELTTPSAALRRLRAFLLMPQPPLLFKEGNVSALKQSANSFTRSDALGSTLAAAARLVLYAKIPAMRRAFGVLLAILLFAASAGAHPVPFSYLDVQLQPGSIAVSF